MFGTIFRRQFITYMGTILIVFLILGAALTGMFSSYFYGQKSDALELQCSRISEEYINSYVARDLFHMINPTFKNEMIAVYNYTGESIFVSLFSGDGGGAKMQLSYWTSNLSSWEGDYEHVNEVMNSLPELQSRTSDSVTFTGNLGGLFDERMMIVACPILYKNYLYGYVFINSPISEIEASISEVIKLSLVCLIASCLIAFIIIYFSSKTISRPIRQMSDAAKVIAGGGFNRRLSVRTKDEVGQLAESFNDMAESLENQEVTRRAFISNISHDLRSPLTSVKGFIQAMLDGTIPEEKRDKYLHIVLDETERVTKMANDLMFIGKFQNFEIELNLTKFDINELVRTTLITFERRINDKNLEIEALFNDEEGGKNIVEADYEKIQRSVYNLIDNAVKYTQPGGQIRVMTETDPRRSDKITVSVKDDGPGIPIREQKEIFDRFYKADKSRGQDKTGSGLGLAIVREFIQAHDEQVKLVSEPGQGSEFSFSLKLVSE